MLDFAKVLDDFLFQHGIETPDNLWYSDALNIYFIPRAFQHHEDSFGDDSVFVGACINRSFQPEWQSQGGSKPVYLISDLSENPDPAFFNTVIEGLTGEDCHCVLSVGEKFPVESLRSLPDNFEINRKISHLDILQHAALAICHGGTGTSLEAIYNGVPVLAFPPTPPTGETAYRLGELGVGLQLIRDEISPAAVKQGVNRLLDDSSLPERVQHVREQFMSSGGARAAVDHIERFLSTR
jgi:MGT family glycosyltransferase